MSISGVSAVVGCHAAIGLPTFDSEPALTQRAKAMAFLESHWRSPPGADISNSSIVKDLSNGLLDPSWVKMTSDI
jgi:hypothetical protein